VVAVPHVELGKVLCLGYAFEEFANEGKWIAILGGDLVEAAVVDAES
jgi:hypothetical protein